MSDTASTDTGATGPTDTSSDETGQSTDTEDTTPDLAAELDKWKSQARKHEERAKANAQAAKELERLKLETMSEQEQAVAQARAEARSEALTEVGGKLAAAEIRAAFAGRMSADRVETLLDGLNVSRFLGEDGEVDRDLVATFVDGIAPLTQDDGRPTVPDLGQGARGSTPDNKDSLARSVFGI